MFKKNKIKVAHDQVKKGGEREKRERGRDVREEKEEKKKKVMMKVE